MGVGLHPFHAKNLQQKISTNIKEIGGRVLNESINVKMAFLAMRDIMLFTTFVNFYSCL